MARSKTLLGKCKRVNDAICRCASTQPSPCAWNVAKVNIERFTKGLGKSRVELEGPSEGDSVATETIMNSLINLITKTYEAFMPRTSNRRDKPSMHWWTTEIANKRREFHSLCRFSKRLHAREEAYTTKVEYRSA